MIKLIKLQTNKPSPYIQVHCNLSVRDCQIGWMELAYFFENTVPYKSGFNHVFIMSKFQFLQIHHSPLL